MTAPRVLTEADLAAFPRGFIRLSNEEAHDLIHSLRVARAALLDIHENRGICACDPPNYRCEIHDVTTAALGEPE